MKINVLKADVAIECTGAGSVVLDVLGRRVRLVADEFRPSGHHEFAWYLDDSYARPLPAGVYLVRMITGSDVRVVRLHQLP